MLHPHSRHFLHSNKHTNIDNMHMWILLIVFTKAPFKSLIDLSQPILTKGQRERFFSNYAGKQLMFALIYNHITSISEPQGSINIRVHHKEQWGPFQVRILLWALEVNTEVFWSCEHFTFHKSPKNVITETNQLRVSVSHSLKTLSWNCPPIALQL